MYDAFSGELVKEQTLHLRYHPDNTIQRHAPRVLERFPRENKRQIIVAVQGGEGVCDMDVDGDRLGRRTWEILH